MKLTVNAPDANSVVNGVEIVAVRKLGESPNSPCRVVLATGHTVVLYASEILVSA